MEKQFVPYELAVKLKELGFKRTCLAEYIDGVFYLSTSLNNKKQVLTTASAPLWQQAFDWFREKYNLVGNTYANASGYLFEIHHSANKGGSHQHDSGFDGPNGSGCWDEFYEARQACLEKLIELITSK